MEEWKEYKLGEIADIQTGPFGSQLHQSDYVEYGTPCIMPTNIGSQLDIKTEGIAHVKDEDVTRLHRHSVKTGDIIYSRRGDIEKCAFISPREEGWLCGTGCLRIRINAENINPHFIAYQLSTKQCKKWIVGNAVGTTMLNLNTSILKDLPLLIPDKMMQDTVVSILKSLDDKIEINRRINDNLEQQAQALFKSWFVDFEPFKDQPFEESELGMIPKGWRVGKLGDVIEVKYGKDHKKLSEGNIPVYGSGGLMRMVDKFLYEGESVLIPRKGTLNNVMYVNESFWTVDTMFYSIPKVDDVVLFSFFLLKSKDLSSMNTGSAVPSMTTEILNNMPLVIPSSKVLFNFNAIVSSFYKGIKQYELESRRLAQLRDLLLPKLMSGEIKV